MIPRSSTRISTVCSTGATKPDQTSTIEWLMLDVSWCGSRRFSHQLTALFSGAACSTCDGIGSLFSHWIYFIAYNERKRIKNGISGFFCSIFWCLKIYIYIWRNLSKDSIYFFELKIFFYIALKMDGRPNSHDSLDWFLILDRIKEKIFAIKSWNKYCADVEIQRDWKSKLLYDV